ncbi:hypothetical protein [Frankia sp. CiP3]|uniref:hypothetical protein n=1 Tax=Frankia sp. CiP3 TaxID=2880971 RepID=UPI001EF600FD|nr:hypothetical protein [Frankia sp. CiP3]
MNGQAQADQADRRDHNGRRRADGAAAAVLRGGLAAAGLAAIGYGIHGLVGMRSATNPPNAAQWLVGGIVVHDLLVVPVTMAVGLVLTRLVPAPFRAVLQGALLISGAVALASLPLWRGYGGPADNPSVNPLPYGRNLAIVLGLLWACATAVIVVRAVRVRRARRSHASACGPPAG